MINEAFIAAARKEHDDRVKAGVAAPERPQTYSPWFLNTTSHAASTTLADDLAHRGWPASRIEKILGTNFARLFAEVWKS